MFRKFTSLICTLCICISSVLFSLNSDITAYAAVKAIWPTEPEFNKITEYFEPGRNTGSYGYHNGIDIPADYGTNIYAPVGGVCESARWTDDYGYLVILWHSDLGVYTFYAHCSGYTVEAGQSVRAGQVIGYVGNTGYSYGNHLHFGVCDTLIGGYPDILYYDPLTFFSFDAAADAPVAEDPPVTDECHCTEDYAGIYTTKGVETYLNVRSGHGTDFRMVGQIAKGSEFTVTKADGEWAHIEYKNLSGFCSMEYITRKEELYSAMEVADPVVPDGQIPYGKPYSISGVVKSNLPIARITGGIYKADGASPLYICEDHPYKYSYDLGAKFDEKLLFNKLDVGTYVYKIEAEDSEGNIYYLIGKSFMVVSEKVDTGDINGDGNISIADGVMLEKFILGMEPLTPEQLVYADLTGDNEVNVYDMVMLRKLYVKQNAKK